MRYLRINRESYPCFHRHKIKNPMHTRQRHCHRGGNFLCYSARANSLVGYAYTASP